MEQDGVYRDGSELFGELAKKIVLTEETIGAVRKKFAKVACMRMVTRN